MLGSLVRSSHPALYGFFPVAIAIGFFRFFFADGMPAVSYDNSVLFFMAGSPDLDSFSAILVFIAAIFLISILLVPISNSHLQGACGPLLPGVMFIFLASALAWGYELNLSVVALLFLLPVIPWTFRLYKGEYNNTEAFNAGFFTGLSSIVYFPSIAFILLFWVGQITLKPYIVRESLVSLLGIVVPWTFALSIIFLFYPDGSFESLMPVLFGTVKDSLTVQEMVLLAVPGLLILFAYVRISVTPVLKKISIRRYFDVSMIALIVASLLLGVIPFFRLSGLYIILLPASVLLALYIAGLLKRIRLVLLFLVFLFLLLLLEYPELIDTVYL